MSKVRVSNRPTPTMSAGTPKASPGSEKTGPAEQTARRAEVHHDRVARHVYELYEQRGRQDGRDLEDWLKAERDLGGAVHHA
jgi:Protein of unknown function (DUF2934)